MEIKQFNGRKDFELTEFKATEKDDVLYISGYANNKHVADRYGDIPTEYNRSYVYELEEYRRNPVILINHCGHVECIAGSAVEIREDDKGLFFKAAITKSDLPVMKHVRQLIKEGHLRTVSIGGMWLYEDLENPCHLTLAKIFEISLVAIPADTYATIAEDKNKSAKGKNDKKTPENLPYKSMAEKLCYFEMKQKLKQFAVKNNKPEDAGKE